MGDGNDNDLSISNPKILIFIAGMGTASILAAIYHCITVGLCDPRRRPLRVRGRPRASTSNSGGMKQSDIQLIPAYKYKKGEKMLRDDATCAVCLSEFEDGEELRTLPECAHSFHVPCIDMWLYSNLCCPICRADAATTLKIIGPRSIHAEREETIVLEHVIVQPHVTQ